MKSATGLAVLSLICLTSACTTLPFPNSSQFTASSMETGESTIAASLYRYPFVSASTGVTNKLDVGAVIEGIPSIWTKYTFIQRPSGLSFASVLGLFSGGIDISDENSPEGYDQKSTKGSYLGLVASWEPLESPLGYVLEVRYSNSQYSDYELSGSRLASHSDNAIFYSTPDTFSVSSEDLEHVVQTNFYLKLNIINRLMGYAGIQCLNNVSEQNPYIPSAICTSAIGLSVTR